MWNGAKFYVEVFSRKYNPGDIIRGKVRSVTDYGVFVGIEDGVDGMVHKSDLSWTERINNPADVYRKGDEVEAIILSMTPGERSNPDLIDGSRRRRIAAGSGRNVQEVNQLLKQFKQARQMMQMMSSGKMPSGLRNMMGM